MLTETKLAWESLINLNITKNLAPKILAYQHLSKRFLIHIFEASIYFDTKVRKACFFYLTFIIEGTMEKAI
jgi:hypothetical protein